TDVAVTEGEVTPNVNFELAKIPPEQSAAISGTVMGDPDPIPEFQYPIIALLVATLIAVVLVKLAKPKLKMRLHA
ncbi:MAG: hypothetical protein ACLFU9_05875, partial [Candidatus Bathyarchaeia archaeon]